MTHPNERKDGLFRGDFGVCTLDVKEVSETGEIAGYASIFSVMDDGGDIVQPGAFAESLTRWPAAKIKMLWQHDPHQIIGKWTEAREDNRGLYMEGRLFTEMPKAKEVHYLLKEEAVEGLSIGYRTRESDRDPKTGARTLQKVDLREVSVVTFPMNEMAGVTLVKNDGTMPSERAFERFLKRDAGFTAEQAKAIIANGYKSLTSARDAGQGDDQELNRALIEAARKINER